MLLNQSKLTSREKVIPKKLEHVTLFALQFDVINLPINRSLPAPDNRDEFAWIGKSCISTDEKILICLELRFEFWICSDDHDV